ncbi:MAG: hypothetical protein AB7I01_12460 [Gammaproteobacteria bacterium]
MRPRAARRAPLWLALAALLLLLRLPSLGWGLPNALHPDYSYHPDEAFFSRWADDFVAGERFRKLFMYGGTAFFSAVAATNRLGALVDPQAAQPLAARIHAGRVANLLVALATLLAIAGAARCLYGDGTALLAGLMWTLSLGPLALGQWLRPDGLFSLMFASHLWALARVARDGPRGGRLVLLGLLLGMAAAVRFPGAVWALGWWPALRLHATAGDHGWWARRLALGAGCALLGFVLLSPSLVTEFAQVWDGVRAQYAQQRGAFAGNVGWGPSAWQYAVPGLALATSFALYPCVLAGLGHALGQRQWPERLVLLTCLPYAALLALSTWAMVAYLLPLLPALVILAARGVTRAAAGRWRTLVTIGFGGCCAAALLLLLAYVRAVPALDPRDACLRWLGTHLQAGTEVALFQRYAGDVFWQPPAGGGLHWRACPMPTCDVTAYLARRPRVVVVERGFLAPLSSRADPRAAAAYEALRRWHAAPEGYRRVASFGRALTLGPWDLSAWPAFGELRGPLPQLDVLLRDREKGDIPIFRAAAPSDGTARQGK